IKVAIGRAGIKVDKREGDGATPAGRYRLVRLWWRGGRRPPAPAMVAGGAVTPPGRGGEKPSRRRANPARPQRPPKNRRPPGRADALYDLIIEINHNQRPRIAGRGSAVFIHVARNDMTPTAGCVSMPAATLRRLLARLGPKTTITIHG